MSGRVSIVIPIFNAREMTGRCIESVLAHARGDFRLILVDDASTDPEMAPMLRGFAQHPAVALFTNEKNLGFTGTANRGMREAAPDDVLLLNSDTEVFKGFLERITACARASERTGIVTPFSNNATLCSVPVPFEDNEIPPGFTPASFDRFVSAVSLRERPALVTAVGFCMFVKRAVLEKTGLFNEEIYGRGFGEENDLCELAKRAGFEIRLCDDLFVWHKGKASFGDEGRERERSNLQLLEARHPGYLRAVQQFALDHPLAALHERIRFHLPRLSAGREHAMLFMLHASPYQERPGGTEHHVLDLVRALALPRAVMMWPERDELVAAEILDGNTSAPLRFEARLREPSRQFSLAHAELEAGLRAWLRAFGIRAAHLHHTMRWPDSVLRVLGEEGVPFVSTAHDFYAVCPNWNLFDASRDTACPCDGSRACETGCLRAFAARADLEPPEGGPEGTVRFREAHRAAMAEGLSRSLGIIFPSRSARDETMRRLPIAPRVDPSLFAVIEHGYDGDSLRLQRSSPSDAGPLRVLVLGETGLPHKGAAAYLRVAEALRGAPVELHFIGESALRILRPELDRRGLAPGAVFHGRIERERLPAALRAIAPHVGLLLSAMVETYSYVVTELALAGIPAVVNDRGAPAERVRESGAGLVVPEAEDAARALRELAEDRARLARLRAQAMALRVSSTAEMAAKVRELYTGAGLLPLCSTPAGDRAPSAEELEALRRQRVGSTALGTDTGRPIEPIARAEPPSSPYQSSAWYSLYARAKALVPGALRRRGRDLLLRRQYPPALVLEPARASLRDLRLVHRRFGEARFEATGPAPRLLFHCEPARFTSGGPLTRLRFRLLHREPRAPRARILWSRGGRELDDEHALRVPLSPRAGAWQDYVVLLGESRRWREEAGELAQLGLELEAAGAIELGFLELG